MACEAGGGGGCWGSGLSLCKPRDCLRQAKGAPDGDGTAGCRVSWKPNANAEGLAGRAEATQVCMIFFAYQDKGRWVIPELLPLSAADRIPGLNTEVLPYLCADRPLPEDLVWNLTFD